MIKLKTYLFLFFIVINSILNAQNQYPDFPRDQHRYLGGMEEFYKDFHNIIIEKNLKPCDNKKELYLAPILIKSFESVEILENKSSQENKCSFELNQAGYK